MRKGITTCYRCGRLIMHPRFDSSGFAYGKICYSKRYFDPVLC